MAALDCTHLILQQSTRAYSLYITYLILFITLSVTCAKRSC